SPRWKAAPVSAGDSLLRQPRPADAIPARRQQRFLAVLAGAAGIESSAHSPVHLLVDLVGGAESRVLGCGRGASRLAYVLQSLAAPGQARAPPRDLPARRRRRRGGRELDGYLGEYLSADPPLGLGRLGYSLPGAAHPACSTYPLAHSSRAGRLV